MGSKVVIRDLGWNRIKEEIRKANNSFVKVGFPDGEGPGKSGSGGSNHEPYADMTEVQQVAAVHEFGAPNRNIPERAFMRPAYDEGRQELNAFIDAQYDAILKGSVSTEDSLRRIGLKHEAQVRAKITKGPFAALKQATIRRKKSTRPLIDTAQMRNAVTSRIFIDGNAVAQ